MHVKKLLITVLCFSSTQLFAAQALPEEQATAAISEEEMAALYVLSQICPALVDDQQQLQQGYENILRDYIPQLKQPAKALQQLSQQPRFATILREAEVTARQAGEQQNRIICEEILAYR